MRSKIRFNHLSAPITQIADAHADAIEMGYEDVRNGEPKRTSRGIIDHFCYQYSAHHEQFLHASYLAGYHQAQWHAPTESTADLPPPVVSPTEDPSLDELAKSFT